MTSLYCMNRSLTPPWQGGLAFSPLPVLPSAVPERIGPWFKVPFRSSILSLQPHFPRFTVLVTDYRTGFVAGGAAHTFPDGISTRLYVMPFPGRTWCQAPLSCYRISDNFMNKKAPAEASCASQATGTPHRKPLHKKRPSWRGPSLTSSRLSAPGTPA